MIVSELTDDIIRATIQAYIDEANDSIIWYNSDVALKL